MKTQHTPGPWHVNSLETVKHTIHATAGHVADATAGTMLERSTDEIEANARLIAAAPELLTFAYFVAAWLTAPELNRTTLDAVQRQARAAIAKATGN